VINEPTLSAERLRRRQEHLMAEIRLMQLQEDPTRATEPVPAHRVHRRPVWLRYGLPGAGLVVAGLAGVIVLSGIGNQPVPDGPPGLAIQPVSDGTVAVQIVDSRVAGKQMTDQLRQRGLDITVETVPTSPQLIGHWVMSGYSAEVPPAIADGIIAQMRGYAATVQVPTLFSGQISLSAGRAPEPGEALMVSGKVNALAPGGRLGCLHASQGDPATVQQAAERYGYTVTWANGDTGRVPPITAPLPGQRAVEAFIDDTTPGTVQIVTATPGTGRYDGRSRVGYAEQQWTDRATNPAACTAA
jgi:hypothetical protein